MYKSLTRVLFSLVLQSLLKIIILIHLLFSAGLLLLKAFTRLIASDAGVYGKTIQHKKFKKGKTPEKESVSYIESKRKEFSIEGELIKSSAKVENPPTWKFHRLTFLNSLNLRTEFVNIAFKIPKTIQLSGGHQYNPWTKLEIAGARPIEIFISA